MTTALHVVYRAAGGTTRKRRPPWFSKSLCFASVLRAAGEHGDTSFTFLCDGGIPDEASDVMDATGDVVDLGGRGNSASYRATVRNAASGAGRADVVYVCEDDYLHVPSALRELSVAAAEAPRGSYLSLYDHPDRYRRADDLGVRGVSITVGGREWHAVESTTMSFATTRRTLRHDLPVHRLVAFGSYPRDRILWRTLQGLGVRRPVSLVLGHRALLAARPGLAVHCEEDALSPGVDWTLLAADTIEWAKDRGLAPMLEAW